MSKLDIISKVCEDMSEDFKNGYIVCQNKIMPFPKFIMEVFPNYVNDNATYETVNKYITDLFSSKVKNFEDMKSTYIEAFINQNNVNEENANWLRTVGIQNMTENFQINCGDKVRTLMSYYELLLKQKDNEPTEIDKLEMCDNYLHKFLPTELLDFYVDSLGMNIYDYVTKEVPKMMANYYQIEVNGNLINIDEFILDLCSQVIKENNRRQQQDIDKINHVSDRPLSVGEIKVELNKDNVLEVTGELPIIISELSSEESKTLIDDGSISKEDILFELLNNLKAAVYKATSQKDLDSLSNMLNNYTNMVQTNPEALVYINSINELIDLKTRSLIIMASNKADYIDAMYGGLIEMDRSVDYSDPNTQENLDFNLTKVKKEMDDKGIKDPQLKSTLNRVTRNRNRTQILGSNNHFDRDRFMIESELAYRAMEIKNQKRAIINSSFDNNFIVGAQVNLEQKVKDFESLVNSSYIDENIKDKYITLVNEILDNQEGLRRGA